MTKPLSLLSSSGGCAAKLGPHELRQITNGLRIRDDTGSSILQTYEDAGFLQISQDLCIAQSVDVITPITDEPYIYGKIAVAHALSDLYAKGAKPITGLLTLGIPALQISAETASVILQGAIDKLYEAKAKFMGGHTITSQQLELGVAVTGIVEKNWVSNNNCQDGDTLILTKPIGNGIIASAQKLKNANMTIEKLTEEIVKGSENCMLQLNETAANIMMTFGVNACTDVSGFGLIGHLYQLLNASSSSAIINWSNIPVLDGAIDLAEQMILPSNCERNAAYWWDKCTFDVRLRDSQKMTLFDPQTSGGLLISTSQEKSQIMLSSLLSAGLQRAAIIGHITRSVERKIVVTFD